MCSRAVRGSDAFPSIETPRVHHAARGAVWPLAARAQQTTPTPVGYSAFATDTCCGKAKGYPIATIKAAAGWLIDSYAEAGIAPAPEAALLVREIIRPNRHASTLPVRRSSEAAYLAAIEFEARLPST
jgi:hypothetical protein